MNAPLTEQQPPREQPTGSSRRITAAGPAWIATRARNASRRAWPIAIVGALAVLATLLVLLLVPREADRVVREQLERIPAALDTLPIAEQLTAMTARGLARRHVDSVRTAARMSATNVPIAADDTLDTDLVQRIARAREVPLAESYLALAEARALRGDERARSIADSIEQVDGERDAYAALGGADARYAALTSQLATLGQRLVRVAEAQGGRTRPLSLPTADSASALDASLADSASTLDASLADSASTLDASLADSASALDAALADSVERFRQQLTAVRLANAALEGRRAQVRAQLGVSVPPFAMLLSALALGLSIGYGVQVLRELRRPTVGDEAEVERITKTRAVVQRAMSGGRSGSVGGRRSGVALPAIIAADEWSYSPLHLALTGVGDAARVAEVIAEEPRFASVVAINVATVAARESRRTLVVEDPGVAQLFDALRRQPTRPGDLSREVASSSSITSILLERDLTIDVLSARMPAEARVRAMDRYDLTLVPLGGRTSADLVDTSAEDVVICVRLAATPLSWLTAVTQRAHARRQRIRAVLLWVGELPTG